MMANVDYACIWILVILFLIFNATFWNWHWI